jgi:tRNA nucleotidyltransferase/poly(A) polymerase
MSYVAYDGKVSRCQARDPLHCRFHVGEPHFDNPLDAVYHLEQSNEDQVKYGCSAKDYEMPVLEEYEKPIQDLSHVGLPLVVGGAVRDSFLHADNKDIDLEIYHVDMDGLISFLRRKKYHVDEVGKRFGVLKVSGNGVHDLDVAVPRSENKVSAGHRGFHVETDTNMTVPEAASRRDYTINAMAYDPVRHRLIDPYGGSADMENHVLRAVGDKFSEDPLRVLRGFQIASRFDLHMDSGTISMCSDLRSAAGQLSKERVREEWRKFYTRSVNPIAGLQVLRSTGWDDTIPGLHDALSSPGIDDEVLHAWASTDRTMIRSAVFGRHMEADDAHSFYRVTLPNYDEARLAVRLTKVDSNQLSSEADRREWEWTNARRGLGLDVVHEYAEAIGDRKLMELSRLDQGVVEPFVNGYDVIRLTERKPGSWVKELLDDVRRKQYEGRFADKAAALDYVSSMNR